jgi:hypothetical protein
MAHQIQSSSFQASRHGPGPSIRKIHCSSYGWVDATLGFPVKWQAADGKVFVVENILLKAQPANLFSIPPDYRKLDPQALLERIKHSDVWADSPQ